MAPEVICGKGYLYNNLVDLWSIGICLFEFLCGYVPFGEDAEDPYEIYEQIIKNDIIYPQFFKDRKAKKLIEQLLSKIPEVRLGNSFANLKGHQWFENFDWVQLITQLFKLIMNFKINQQIKIFQIDIYLIKINQLLVQIQNKLINNIE